MFPCLVWRCAMWISKTTEHRSFWNPQYFLPTSGIANLCMCLLFFFFFNNFSMLIFQLTYFHFHLFISGTVVFSVDFIGGLDTYSYRQPPQEHVELKPVKPVGKVLVLWTTLILLTGLKANLLLT